jgi:hypothetical protein
MPDLSAHANNMKRFPELEGEWWFYGSGKTLEEGHTNYMSNAPDEAAQALGWRYMLLLWKHGRYLIPPVTDPLWAVVEWDNPTDEHKHADPLEACRLAVEAMENTDER